MTILVGMRCTDGVVIGSDGSATFGSPANGFVTVGQPTKEKIQIHSGKIIVAGSGHIGSIQRFSSVVKSLWSDNKLKGDSREVGNALSASGIQEFANTRVAQGQIPISALVAMPVNRQPTLYEFTYGTLQPEIKTQDDLWYVSTGSGQANIDPFLGFLRSVFWTNHGSPSLREGILMTLWALEHACEVAAGGIGPPIAISVLEKSGKDYAGRKLSDENLEEIGSSLEEIRQAMRLARDTILSGIDRTDGSDIPK